MTQTDRASLWNWLCAGRLTDRILSGTDTSVSLGDLVQGSSLDGRAEELRGRSVLVLTRDQFTAATCLIELDGIARRLILCPPDLPAEHLAFVVDAAEVDVIVSDQNSPGPKLPTTEIFITCTPTLIPSNYDRSQPRKTEWILLTSGSTGQPKLVVHNLDSLAGGIEQGRVTPIPVVWSTFYDIRRYGGLVIFLRALLTGTSLVLSGAQESTADFMTRAGKHGVTHISGTPSHWRRALMSPSAHLLSPQYIRLSGEIADQAILDHLRSFYPKARIVHAFASTEAGVAFDVEDGLVGFPADLVGKREAIEMKVEDGTLRIRSGRNADRYLGDVAKPLRDWDGFVDTADVVELRGNRYYFAGRRDGVINIGGQKVHPEEVEAVINRHPGVRISLVKTRKNPITGALVVAEVVLNSPPPTGNGPGGELADEILQLCRSELPRHKVPATIQFVDDLPVATTGKMVRNHA